MFTKVPMADEGLFYTQQIDFEPVEVIVEEVSDTESFDDYLWMENEEEFEKTEMQRLEEEALMEECAEAMQDEEEDTILELCSSGLISNSSVSHQTSSSTISRVAIAEEEEEEESGSESEADDHLLALVSSSATESTLNPLAIEFIPAN